MGDLEKRKCFPFCHLKTMIWIFLLALILQSSFFWLLNPLIVVSTNYLFDLQGLNVIVFLVLFWIFSGRGKIENL